MQVKAYLDKESGKLFRSAKLLDAFVAKRAERLQKQQSQAQRKGAETAARESKLAAQLEKQQRLFRQLEEKNAAKERDDALFLAQLTDPASAEEAIRQRYIREIATYTKKARAPGLVLSRVDVEHWRLTKRGSGVSTYFTLDFGLVLEFNVMVEQALRRKEGMPPQLGPVAVLPTMLSVTGSSNGRWFSYTVSYDLTSVPPLLERVKNLVNLKPLEAKHSSAILEVATKEVESDRVCARLRRERLLGEKALEEVRSKLAQIDTKLEARKLALEEQALLANPFAHKHLLDETLTAMGPFAVSILADRELKELPKVFPKSFD